MRRTIIMCDKCQSDITSELEFPPQIYIERIFKNIKIPLDLCDKCYDDLIDFLDLIDPYTQKPYLKYKEINEGVNFK